MAAPKENHGPESLPLVSFWESLRFKSAGTRFSAQDMRDCFLKIIEGIWEDSVFPVLQQAHKDGFRSDTSRSTLA